MLFVVLMIVVISVGTGLWNTRSSSSPVTENEETNYVVITCYDVYGNTGDDYCVSDVLTEEDNENKPLFYKDVVLNLTTGELLPFHNGDDYKYNTVVVDKEQYDSLRKGKVNLDEYRDFTSMELVE